MSSRLDELFSPDRLRQNWQKPVTPTATPVQNAPTLVIHSQYHELQRLIAEKYPDASRLTVNFAELTEQINRAFPLDTDSAPVELEQKEAIVSLLEALEELIWAMDLSLRHNKP